MYIRTTLELDQERIEELMRLQGTHTKTEAIHRAIDECIRAYKRARLKSLAGKVKIEADWRELRDRDR